MIGMVEKKRSVFGMRHIIKLLCMGLVILSMAGCNWKDNDDDDDDSSKIWTLTMQYMYFYYTSGDNTGLLQREEDDNNADGIVDEYWVYQYENDPIDAEKRRISRYDHYTGPFPAGVRDAEGIYTYDDGGKLIKLEHEALVGDSIGRWDYNYNSEGLRIGYTYFFNDQQAETGIYIYDANNHNIELRTTNGTWKYDVSSDGVKLNYDFYQNNVVVREGEYIYDGGSGRLIRLDSYELL